MDAKKKLEQGLDNLCGAWENEQLGVSWDIRREDLEHPRPRWQSENPPEYKIINYGKKAVQVPTTQAEKDYYVAVARQQNAVEAERIIDAAGGWADAIRGAAMSPNDAPVKWGRSPRYYTEQRDPPTPAPVVAILTVAAFIVVVGIIMIITGILHVEGVITL